MEKEVVFALLCFLLVIESAWKNLLATCGWSFALVAQIQIILG